MTKFFISNGLFRSATDNDLPIREGGVFETMRAERMSILLKEFHFERLFSGLQLMNIHKPAEITSEFLDSIIKELLFKNNHTESARVRLRVFKELDTSASKALSYTIESWPLAPMQMNKEGLSIGLYTIAKKQCDLLSNLKANKREPYIEGGKFADLNKLDDCIILNNYNRVCDTTIANIFLIKDDTIYTPSLNEGCVAGVMRRNIIMKLKKSYSIVEKEMPIEDVKEADEIFLSNAIKGIRWVASFEEKLYTNNLTKEIYRVVFP